MTVNSYDIVTRAGLVPRLKAAINSNLDGLRDLIALTSSSPVGALVVVKPRLDGTWPTQTRTPGDIRMWLRAINATDLAPMPAEGDGYVPGDLVSPFDAEVVETRASTSVLFSDSLLAAPPVQVDGRVGDAFAGGLSPQWIGDTSTSTAPGAHAHVQTDGLKLYDNAYAAVASPRLPTAWRATFNVKIGDNNQAGIVLRGSSRTNNDATLIRWKRTGDTLTCHTITRSIGVTNTFGTAAFPGGTGTVTVTVDGGTINVNVAGTTLPTTTIPTATPALEALTFNVGSWHAATFRNLIVETI